MAKKIILWLPLLLFFSHNASAHLPKTLVSQVSKNTVLPIFSFTLNTNEEYFIHIGGPFIVRGCNDGCSRPVVPCGSATCALTLRFIPHQCPLPNNTVVNGQCACQASAFEPFLRLCNSNQFTYGNFKISSLNPRKPSVSIDHVYYLCIPVPFLPDFPPGVFGLVGLSPTALSGQNQLTPEKLGLGKKFAFCLPSDENPNNKGAIFFGGGPYKLVTHGGNILSYTPLIKNPKRLNNYYIGLKGISVNGKKIPLRPNPFEFDSNGDGGVTLSTLTQYTTLRSDVYKAFVKEFSEATWEIPRVNNTSPFGLCLKTSRVLSGHLGLNVPRVDLKLANEKTWTVFGANSMKNVGADMACLAFVDGGEAAEQAVVIGTYQMENNLLEFDVESSTLGFSSSLGLVKASCCDFQTRP